MIFFSFFCCFSLTALRKLQQGPKGSRVFMVFVLFCVYFGYVPDCYLCLNLCLLSSLWENGNCKFILFLIFFWVLVLSCFNVQMSFTNGFKSVLPSVHFSYVCLWVLGLSFYMFVYVVCPLICTNVCLLFIRLCLC